MTADFLAAAGSGFFAVLLLTHNIVLQRRATRQAIALLDAANIVASLKRELHALREHVDKLHRAGRGGA